MSYLGAEPTQQMPEVGTGTVETQDIQDGAVTAAKLAAGAAVPSQTGNANKFLTTDGTTASWGIITPTLKITAVAYPDNDTAVDTAGAQTITITGVSFASTPTVYIGGTIAPSVTFVSSTTLTVTTPAKSAGTYDIYVVNPDGATAIRVYGISYSGVPTWTTAAGSLGTLEAAWTVQLQATSNSAVTYALTSGSTLPSGVTLNSSGLITGTGVNTEQTFNFSVTATDAENQDTPRSFSITISLADPYFKYTTLLLTGNGAQNNTFLDSSTNNFNVTINGDARSDNFTPYQAGYYSNYFNGTSSWNLASASSTAFAFGSGGAWAFEAWVFPTASMSDSWVMQTADAGNMRLRITTGGVLGWYSDTYGGGLNSSTVVPVNSWSHVAATYDGATLRLFQNGVLTTSLSSGSITNGTTAVSAYIGNWSGGSRAFNGYISNARIVKGSAVYTSAFTPSTTPLTAISGTSLLTCQSNRFVDTSSNAFAITVNGSPQVSPAQPFTLPTTVATYGSGYFDGSGDTLSLASQAALNFGTGDFTLEAWVYPTTTLGDATCIFSAVTNGGMMFGTNGAAGSGVWAIGRKNTAWDYSSSTVPALNQWQHVAVCRSGTSVRIFINGVQSGTTGTNSTAYDLSLGGTVIGYQVNYMNGYFCSIRASNTALYTTTFTPPTVPFTAVSGTQLLTTQYNGGGNNSGFKDSSQFNFPITRNGNTTQGTFTPYGSNWSNYLGGAGNYFQTPASSATTIVGTLSSTVNLTIECWIYPTAYNSSANFPGLIGDMVATVENNNWSWGITNTGTLMLYWNTGTQLRATSASAVSLNTWTHIALNVSAGAITMYINGVSQTLSGTTTLSTPASSNGYLVIGQWNNGSGGTGGTSNGLYTGYISNLRVVKASTYTSSFTPSTVPLTAITSTSLLYCQSNRFVDNSSNALVITLGGSPSVQRFSPFSPTTAYSTSVIGGSGYFDGTGDYLTTSGTGSFNPRSTFTVEFWTYPISNNTVTWINSNTNNNFYFETNGTTLFVGDGTINTIGTSAPTVNQWTHMLLSFDGTTYRLFYNGVSQATSTNLLQSNVISAFRIGQKQDGTRPFNGYITDMRVLVGTAVYTTAFTPPTAPITAITNTSLLLNYTNAGILDNAMMNDLENVGNAQISTSVKKYGTGSMYFDGSGDYLFSIANQTNNFGTGNFTIECWINFASVGNAQIVSAGTGNNSGAHYWQYYSGQLQFGIQVLGTITATSWTPTANTWYHIAVVRSGTNVYQFVDGTQLGTTATSSQNFVDGPTYIGYGGAGYLNGYLDDLRVTKGYARYTANFTPPTAAFKLR